ncbi:uncharacterized protein ABIC65_002630 [Sphingomonas trueperi]|uniref:DUF418 domain-containing protein n=1 Tax=Sphingomonas trueperi TaxID=53317 RepID=UPI00339A532E
MPSLDVLRGAALLGILVINIQIFAGAPSIAFNVPLRVVTFTGEHPVLNAAVMVLQWLFFEGKMRALFSMLFGAGALLLLSRIEAREGAGTAAKIFHRRNLWLLLFGTLHGTLIWNGDVLFFYAAVALLALYPLRRLAGKWLIGIGLAVALVGGTFGVWNMMDVPAAWSVAQLEEKAQDAIAKGESPTTAEAKALAGAQAARRDQIAGMKAAPAPAAGAYVDGIPAAAYRGFVTAIFSSGWILETLGFLIAGMGLFKTGFLTGRLSSAHYVAIAVLGYALAFPIILGGLAHAHRYGFSSAVTTVAMMAPYELQTIAASLADASILLLLVRHGKMLPVQRALAAVGRMALTNYIATSAICTGIFTWTATLPTGTLEQYQMMLVVLSVWAFNIAFSLAWLRFFSFGPLEWLWRSLTYWKLQPMLPTRKRSA